MRDASLINNTTLATASHSKGMKTAHYPLASLLLLLTLLLDRVHSSSSSSSVAVDAGTPRAGEPVTQWVPFHGVISSHILNGS